MTLAASVIVSTYNRPAHLEYCLEGFRHQSVLDFEILVADDGSGPDTARVIQEACAKLPVQLRHICQEDKGFRKCRVLNQAVRSAETDYLIFTDADCVPHRRFVENHLRYRAPGRFLVGRSVKWGPARSARIDLATVAAGRHARFGLRDIIDNIWGQTRYLPYGIYLPGDLSFRLVQRLKKNRNARGGNLSMWKSDLERVNGWNQDFESWGLEDVELGLRLRRAGLDPKLVINRATTFHLYHREGDRKNRSARNAYNATKSSELAWCPNGINSTIPAPGDSAKHA